MNKIYEDLKRIFEGKILFRFLFVIGIFIVALLIFCAGVAVGFHKASFGRDWNEHYMENFGMMPARQSFSVGGNYFPNAHGTTGKIIKIDKINMAKNTTNIILEDRDNLEKSVSIDTNTLIQKARMNINVSDLNVDDFIVVIGTPDDRGMIEAKLVRVLPSPEFLMQ